MLKIPTTDRGMHNLLRRGVYTRDQYAAMRARYRRKERLRTLKYALVLLLLAVLLWWAGSRMPHALEVQDQMYQSQRIGVE